MKKLKSLLLHICYLFAFLYAIFDAQTVVNGATEGVQLSVSVIIPSLFPFIFLSLLCSSTIGSRSLLLLSPVECLCGIPKGAGSLLLLGLMGGYPVGAQIVSHAYVSGSISKKDGERMLGFCSNAGPSFIFGMIGSIFQDIRLCCLLWLTQILSALCVGVLLPGKSRDSCHITASNKVTPVEALSKAVGAIAKICGWVILFRCLICVLNKRILKNLPSLLSVCVTGILELSNGCVGLGEIGAGLERFVLAGALLAFGGFCVSLQTKSVCKGLSLRYYFPGKALQSIISIPICWILWKISVAL